jgi:HAE1 family hydrophobic/amphiphilic exporter-1
MALALGEGGESTAPLARAVIGGLSSSTLVTLVFIPIVYMVFSGGLKELKQIKAMEKAQKQK